MKSTEYVISIIDSLVERFPNIKCSYEFDSFDNSHTVEVLPSIFFNSEDVDFKSFENNIYIEFFKLYPYEVIFFITNTYSYPVQNPIYVKEGREYLPLSNTTINNCEMGFVSNFNEIKIYADYLNKSNYVNVATNSDTAPINIEPNHILQEIAGESNYALAA